MSLISELLTTLLWRGTDDRLREQLRQELLEADSWNWPVLRDFIVTHPASDGPRLLAADWLTDEGQEDRAQFIRLQCRWGYLRDIFGAEADSEPEAIALDSHLEDLLAPLTESLTADLMPLDDAHISLAELGEVILRGSEMTLHYQRGFLSRIDLPTPVFLEQAANLCRTHPLTTIRLSDKNPVKVYGGHWWWADSCLDPTEPACLARHVPPVLYQFLSGSTRRNGQRRQGVHPADLTFSTAEAAWHALSEACISYGHSLAFNTEE